MKLILFVVGTLLCGASAFTRFPHFDKEAPPQCIDPTFACQDLASARLCGVVKTCIHDVWSHIHIPDSNDEVCDICKEMVKEARDQLLSNMTQEEIKEVFEGSCKLIPIKLVADGCVKVVDEIIPELIEMLASRMDPTMVCTVSGMCFPSECRPTKKERNLKDELECEFCEHLLKHVIDLITANTTVEEFRTALLNFCKVIGKYEDKCTSLVNNYFDTVFDYIRKLDTKGMCTLMGLCGTNRTCTKVVPLTKLIPTREPLRKIPLIKIQRKYEINDIFSFLKKKEFKKINDIECDLCKEVVTEVENLIKDQKTEDAIKAALDKVCSYLPSSIAPKCVNFVNQYTDLLIQLLAEELDPDMVCAAMNVCPS